jgi:S1-C subfamily serine protease
MPSPLSHSLAITVLATGWACAQAGPFTVDPTPIPPNPESDMLAKVTPAIVSVFPGRLAKTSEGEETSPESPMDRYFRPDAETEKDKPSIEGVGSGVIVAADGLIITNHHVVTLSSGSAADSIIIELTDRRRFSAKLVGSDRLTDLALLKIEAEQLPTLNFADSAKVRVGDPVFAVGNPFRVGLTVTRGIVSALDRSGLNIGGSNSFEGFIQTDAPINPGNSGGALTDSLGRLVGINTAIFSQGAGNIGIGFSVPSNLALAVATQLLKDGKIHRGFFGASANSVDQEIAEKAQLPAITGVQLSEVVEGGPAHQAGWKQGDIITTINGQAVVDRGGFRLLLSLIGPGEVAVCGGFSEGKSTQFKVTLGDLTQAGAGEFEIQSIPGLRLKPSGKGLEIVAIAKNSAAATKFKIGQVLLALNGEKTLAAPALEAAIRKGVNTFTVLSADQEITVILRLE